MVQLLACTGQRRDEVAGMRWDELDFDARSWTLPRGRVKNDQGHEVPLHAAALRIIHSIQRIEDSPFVLTNTGTAPASGYSKGKRKLDALLPGDTAVAAARSSQDRCERLGAAWHQPAGDREGAEPFQRELRGHRLGLPETHFADEKRAALDAWGQHVETLIRGKPGKVVHLHPKA